MKKTAIRLGLLIFILEGRKMNAVYAGRLGGTCRDFWVILQKISQLFLSEVHITWPLSIFPISFFFFFKSYNITCCMPYYKVNHKAVLSIIGISHWLEFLGFNICTSLTVVQLLFYMFWAFWLMLLTFIGMWTSFGTHTEEVCTSSIFQIWMENTAR